MKQAHAVGYGVPSFAIADKRSNDLLSQMHPPDHRFERWDVIEECSFRELFGIAKPFSLQEKLSETFVSWSEWGKEIM